MTSPLAWYWQQCWYRLVSRTLSHRAYQVSMVSTRLLFRYWLMHCTVPVASWFLGPDSALVAIILGVVFPLSQGNALRAVALAGMMAVVSGLVCIVAGVARLGFVTELLSKPIRYGYMNGIALAVVISQLPKVFGFSIDVD